MIDIVLLDFWSMQFSWIFISSCTNIYFFVKKFIFSMMCSSETVAFLPLDQFLLSKNKLFVLNIVFANQS